MRAPAAATWTSSLPQLNFRLAVWALATVERGETGANAQTANDVYSNFKLRSTTSAWSELSADKALRFKVFVHDMVGADAFDFKRVIVEHVEASVAIKIKSDDPCVAPKYISAVTQSFVEASL